MVRGSPSSGPAAVALPLAARALGFGRTFALLVLVLHFLKAHLELLVAADPLDRQVDGGDDHQPPAQRDEQRYDRAPCGRQLLRQIAAAEAKQAFVGRVPPYRGDRAEQRDLEQALAHLDQPVRAEHPLETRERIDALALGLEVVGHPSATTETELG